MTSGSISRARKAFHAELIRNGILAIKPFKHDKWGFEYIASNADRGQRASVAIANSLAGKLESSTGEALINQEEKKKGQTLGNEFEDHCCQFLRDTFGRMDRLRPGGWVIEKVGSRAANILGRYEQYSHLADLARLSSENPELKSYLGEGYTVAPDIVVARCPEKDEAINADHLIVDGETGLLSAIRESTHPDPDNPLQMLHASVSCKFTMRSDRSQNTRTEALNLIRNRKGRSPNIVAVTSEPMPSRVASLALGTGDMDCVYHFALYELRQALEELGYEDSLELLNTMVSGKRLKDISDLPLDLAI